MNAVWKSVGTLAAITVSFAIAGMNFVHGSTLLADERSKLVLGFGMVALDALKSATPFFIHRAAETRAWMRCGIGGAIWVVLTAISLYNVSGFLNGNRAQIASEREQKKEAADDHRDAIKRARAEVDELGVRRPSTQVSADIDAALLGAVEIGGRKVSLGAATGECRERTRIAVEHCSAVLGLRAELARSVAAEKAKGELEELLKKPRGVSPETDPQATFLARLFKSSRPTMELVLVILLAAGFELASSLGLFIALAPGGKTQSSSAIKAMTEDEPRESKTIEALTIAAEAVDVEACRGAACPDLSGPELTRPELVRPDTSSSLTSASGLMLSMGKGEVEVEERAAAEQSIGRFARDLLRADEHAHLDLGDAFEWYEMWREVSGECALERVTFEGVMAELSAAAGLALTIDGDRRSIIGLALGRNAKLASRVGYKQRRVRKIKTETSNV